MSRSSCLCNVRKRKQCVFNYDDCLDLLFSTATVISGSCYRVFARGHLEAHLISYENHIRVLTRRDVLEVKYLLLHEIGKRAYGIASTSSATMSNNHQENLKKSIKFSTLTIVSLLFHLLAN